MEEPYVSRSAANSNAEAQTVERGFSPASKTKKENNSALPKAALESTPGACPVGATPNQSEGRQAGCPILDRVHFAGKGGMHTAGITRRAQLFPLIRQVADLRLVSCGPIAS